VRSGRGQLGAICRRPVQDGMSASPLKADIRPAVSTSAMGHNRTSMFFDCQAMLGTARGKQQTQRATTLGFTRVLPRHFFDRCGQPSLSGNQELICFQDRYWNFCSLPLFFRRLLAWSAACTKLGQNSVERVRIGAATGELRESTKDRHIHSSRRTMVC
jgi:hypothetical protein